MPAVGGASCPEQLTLLLLSAVAAGLGLAGGLLLGHDEGVLVLKARL